MQKKIVKFFIFRILFAIAIGIFGVSVGHVRATTTDWTFSNGVDFTYDNTYIDVSSGLATLKTVDQTDSDNTSTGFGGGTYANTEWNMSVSAVQLSSLQTSGTFTSRIIDAGSSVVWSTINWTPYRPSLKSLPDNNGIETAYTAGNVDMTNNVLLMHMNESSGVIQDTSGLGNNGTASNLVYATGSLFSTGHYFDGTSMINVPFSSSLNITDELTFEMWIKPEMTDSGYGGLFSKGNFTYLFAMHGHVLAYYAMPTWKGGSLLVSNDVWHHIAMTLGSCDVNGTNCTLKFYVDGQLDPSVYTDVTHGSLSADPLQIGQWPSYIYSGSMDEIAIYHRVLSLTEIADHASRGLNRMKFQVRSCVLSNCSDGTFVGPDGTAATYFSELTNSAVSPPAGMSLSGVSANQYAQYQVSFQNDVETNRAALLSVQLGPTHYPTSSPSIVNMTPVPFTQLQSFAETLGGGNQGSVSYQISRNATDFYYNNGLTWVAAATPANSNSASSISSTISSFPSDVGTGNFYFKAFMNSNGSQIVSLDNVQLVSLNYAAPTATAISPSQTSANLVTFTTTVADVDSDVTSSTVEYSTDGVSWSNATLGAVTETSGEGTVTTSTGKIYSIDTNVDGSVDLSINWNAAADVPNTEDATVYLRITPDDGLLNGTAVTSGAFAVDTKAPAVPGNLTVGTLGTTTAQLTFGAQATDANFSQYKIFYKLGASGVTTADTAWTTANDANLGFVNYNAASASTLTGLSLNTQYVANIWAYDTFLRNTAASTERTFYTLAATPGTPTTTVVSTTSLNVVIAENSNPSTVTYALCTTDDGTSCAAGSSYVQANGTLGASAVWQDYTTWGGLSGKDVTGLSVNTSYKFLVQAKNGAGTTTALSSASTALYTLANTPGTPTTSAVSPTSLNVVILQNSNPATVTTYAICTTTNGTSCAAGSSYVQANGSLNTSAVWQDYATWGGVLGQNVTGFSINTSHQFLAQAKNGDGTTTLVSSASTVLYTLANAPGLPIATVQSASSMKVLIDENGNPGTVTYSICTTADGTSCAAGSSYVQANGTLGASAVWQDYTTWGGLSGKVVTGLSASTAYRFLVQAKNLADVTTAFSTASASATTLSSGNPGGGGWSAYISDTPNQPLALTVNSGATSTNSRVVVLNLTAGSNVIGMAISRTLDFANASQEPYEYTRIWDLCSPLQTVCASGTYSVYVKYFTSSGASNAPIQATIEYTPGLANIPIQILPTPVPVLPIIPITPAPPGSPFFQLPVIQIISRVPDTHAPTPPLPPILQIPDFLFPKFLRNLSLGSRSTDVKAVQVFLNAQGYFVALTGAGSPGKETTYFGPATKLALIKYQRAFLKEILGPNATIRQANGTFGPSTRAYVNRVLGK